MNLDTKDRRQKSYRSVSDKRVFFLRPVLCSFLCLAFCL